MQLSILTTMIMRTGNVTPVSPPVTHSDWSYTIPLDAQGWSILPAPAADARLIYVSSVSGNDGTGSYTDIATVDSLYEPTNVNEFATIKAAKAHLRADKGDWILLKSGEDHLNYLAADGDDNPIYTSAGESYAAMKTITSYGTSTQRPIVKTGVTSGVRCFNPKYIAVVGIDFYAHHRDPDGVDFIGWTALDAVDSNWGCSGFSFNDFNDNGTSKGILVEDCIFRSFKGGGGFQDDVTDCVVRRNQILNSISVDTHSSGFYASKASILMEENLFDHNGWYQQRYGALNDKSQGQATYFNHNIYYEDTQNCVTRNNIVSRAASVGIKLRSNSSTGTSNDMMIDDNLVLEGEVAIGNGGGDDTGSVFRYLDHDVINNVCMHIGEKRPTDRGLAWHIEVNDTDQGLVDNNYMLFNDNKANISDVQGVSIIGHCRDVATTDNYSSDLGGDVNDWYAYKSFGGETSENVTFSNNVESTAVTTTGTRQDLNSYLNIASPTDNGIPALITLAKAQRKGNWDVTYTAAEINKHLRLNSVPVVITAPVMGVLDFPEATVGVGYVYQIPYTGDAPTSTTIESGTLPSWASVSATGLVTGDPDSDTNAPNISASFTNSGGTSATSNTDTLVVISAPAASVLTVDKDSRIDITPINLVSGDTIELRFKHEISAAIDGYDYFLSADSNTAYIAIDHNGNRLQSWGTVFPVPTIGGAQYDTVFSYNDQTEHAMLITAAAAFSLDSVFSKSGPEGESFEGEVYEVLVTQDPAGTPVVTQYLFDTGTNSVAASQGSGTATITSGSWS